MLARARRFVDDEPQSRVWHLEGGGAPIRLKRDVEIQVGVCLVASVVAERVADERARADLRSALRTIEVNADAAGCQPGAISRAVVRIIDCHIGTEPSKSRNFDAQRSARSEIVGRIMRVDVRIHQANLERITGKWTNRKRYLERWVQSVSALR